MATFFRAKTNGGIEFFGLFVYIQQCISQKPKSRADDLISKMQ